MPGTSSTNWFVWSMKDGMIRAMIPASTPMPPSRASSAPIGRGIAKRSSSRSAAAARTIATMTVMSTASISVRSCSNSSPSTSKPAASSTAR